MKRLKQKKKCLKNSFEAKRQRKRMKGQKKFLRPQESKKKTSNEDTTGNEYQDSQLDSEFDDNIEKFGDQDEKHFLKPERLRQIKQVDGGLYLHQHGSSSFILRTKNSQLPEQKARVKNFREYENALLNRHQRLTESELKGIAQKKLLRRKF